MKNKILIGVGIVVVVVGAYFGYKWYQKNKATNSQPTTNNNQPNNNPPSLSHVPGWITGKNLTGTGRG